MSIVGLENKKIIILLMHNLYKNNPSQMRLERNITTLQPHSTNEVSFV